MQDYSYRTPEHIEKFISDYRLKPALLADLRRHQIELFRVKFFPWATRGWTAAKRRLYEEDLKSWIEAIKTTLKQKKYQ